MVSDRLKMSLLPALQAILETASVTRAAEMMHVTQSTMSRTLGQLRNILNDPILLRDGNHIYLSKKAMQIQPMVDKLVAEADFLFDGPSFDPATCQQQFRVTAGGAFVSFFLIGALAEINHKAPGITFSISANRNDSLDNLENGELDLGFMQLSGPYPGWLQVSQIIRQPVGIIVHKSHPLSTAKISDLAELDAYPYVGSKSPLHEQQFAEILKSRSKSMRHPWLMVETVHAAHEALKHNDAFTIANPVGLLGFSHNPDYVSLKIPLDLPEPVFHMVWPEHWEFSHAHQWLRKELEQSLRTFLIEIGRGENLINE